MFAYLAAALGPCFLFFEKSCCGGLFEGIDTGGDEEDGGGVKIQ